MANGPVQTILIEILWFLRSWLPKQSSKLNKGSSLFKTLMVFFAQQHIQLPIHQLMHPNHCLIYVFKISKAGSVGSLTDLNPANSSHLTPRDGGKSECHSLPDQGPSLPNSSIGECSLYSSMS